MIQDHTHELKSDRILQYETYETAVTHNGDALEFVPAKYKTDEICTIAVSNCGHSLKYVLNKTLEICMIAVNNDGDALKYIKNKSSKICRHAIKNEPCAIEFVDKNHPRYYRLCKMAIKRDALALRYVENLTEELCEIATRKTKKYREDWDKVSRYIKKKDIILWKRMYL